MNVLCSLCNLPLVDHPCPSGPVERMDSGAVVEFILAKLAEAKKAVRCREEAGRVWNGGTNQSWKKVGCKMTKAERVRVAAKEAHIAIRCRREVEMFEAALERLEREHQNEQGGLLTRPEKTHHQSQTPRRVSSAVGLGVRPQNAMKLGRINIHCAECDRPMHAHPCPTEERVSILRCNEGLVQLRECPICHYTIKEVDVVWERQPNDLSDRGVIARCRWCPPPNNDVSE